MLTCFSTTAVSTPIEIMLKTDKDTWFDKQSSFIKNWVKAVKNGCSFLLIPDETGQLGRVVFL